MRSLRFLLGAVLAIALLGASLPARATTYYDFNDMNLLVPTPPGYAGLLGYEDLGFSALWTQPADPNYPGSWSFGVWGITTAAADLLWPGQQGIQDGGGLYWPAGSPLYFVVYFPPDISNVSFLLTSPEGFQDLWVNGVLYATGPVPVAISTELGNYNQLNIYGSVWESTLDFSVDNFVPLPGTLLLLGSGLVGLGLLRQRLRRRT